MTQFLQGRGRGVHGAEPRRGAGAGVGRGDTDSREQRGEQERGGRQSAEEEARAAGAGAGAGAGAVTADKQDGVRGEQGRYRASIVQYHHVTRHLKSSLDKVFISRQSHKNYHKCLIGPRKFNVTVTRGKLVHFMTLLPVTMTAECNILERFNSHRCGAGESQYCIERVSSESRYRPAPNDKDQKVVIDRSSSQAMDAFPTISEGTGNTPNAILGTAQADRPSIVLGGIDLRERRVNYASGVVEWRMVHVAELLRSYEDTPICINPTEWEQEGLRERVWVQKSFRSAITQESAQARMCVDLSTNCKGVWRP
ncbi:hypothetical protein B0H14DRAFT_2610237 [Mycena olivaceomarginata]|nr:hypothetical protein B0H14DRAFT_2610237 [Mycena olivaceomarginata]